MAGCLPGLRFGVSLVFGPLRAIQHRSCTSPSRMSLVRPDRGRSVVSRFAVSPAAPESNRARLTLDSPRCFPEVVLMAAVFPPASLEHSIECADSHCLRVGEYPSHHHGGRLGHLDLARSAHRCSHGVEPLQSPCVMILAFATARAGTSVSGLGVPPPSRFLLFMQMPTTARRKVCGAHPQRLHGALYETQGIWLDRPGWLLLQPS